MLGVLLYAKIQLMRLKGKITNEDIIEIRKIVAQLEGIYYNIILDATKAVKEVIENGKEWSKEG